MIKAANHLVLHFKSFNHINQLEKLFNLFLCFLHIGTNPHQYIQIMLINEWEKEKTVKIHAECNENYTYEIMRAFFQPNE